MKKLVFAWLLLLALFSVCTSYSQETAVNTRALLSDLKAATSDTARLRLQLALCTYYILKPFELTVDFDSARYFLQLAKKNCIAVNSQMWFGRYWLTNSRLLREIGETREGMPFAKKAIDVFRKYPQSEELGDAIIELSNYYSLDTSSELDEKISLYEQAALVFESVSALKKLGDALKSTGECYAFEERFLKAIPPLERTLAIYKAVGYNNYQGTYDVLGKCYSGIGDHKKAVEYGLLSLRNADLLKDTLMLCTLYNHVGASYQNAKHYDEAINYFSKSLQQARWRNDTASTVLLSINIANTYRLVNRPGVSIKLMREVEGKYKIKSNNLKKLFASSAASAYLAAGQPGKAKPYIDRLIVLGDFSDSDGQVYKILINYNLAIKKYSEVYKYCNVYQKVLDDNGSRNDLAKIYYWRFQADSSLGKFLPAIRHYQRFKMLEDSAYTQDNNRQINLMSVTYETIKKNGDLKLKEANIIRLNKENLLHASEISRANLVRNVIIVGTIVLFLLLVLLYNQYRIKKKQFVITQNLYGLEHKTNEQLVLKQEEVNRTNSELRKMVVEKEWLVKEIHHRVKNNLQIVMSLLNTQSDFSSNVEAFDTIRQSRQRMYAISLIHQKLYHANKLTIVNMAFYIPELIDFLKDGYVEGNLIDFELNIEGIELDVVQAVPVGLILNEAITNSLKHAFKHVPSGRIKVTFGYSSGGTLNLSVHDNGNGLPADFDVLKKGSMGIQLIETLSEQLGGSVSFHNDGGFSVLMSFKQRPVLSLEQFQ